MGCGTSFVKYVLFFFNLLFALVGLAMVGIGVAVLLKWSVVRDALDHQFNVAPWVFIVIGAVVFIIAFFGCCGAIRESHCMIVTYAIFLLVIIIVQVVLAVLMFTYSANIKDGLSKAVYNLYKESQTDTAAASVFHNFEQQLQCCGNDGPGDYGPSSIVNLPDSCCTRGLTVGHVLGDKCQFVDANKVGCGPMVTDLFLTWNRPIAGIAIGIACVEVVGALFALCLANSIRNMDRRSLY